MALPNSPQEKPLATIELKDEGLSFIVKDYDKAQARKLMNYIDGITAPMHKRIDELKEIPNKERTNEFYREIRYLDRRALYYRTLRTIITWLTTEREINILEIYESAKIPVLGNLNPQEINRIIRSAWKDALYFLSDRKVFTEEDPSDTLKKDILEDLEAHKREIRAKLTSSTDKK